LLYSIYRLAFKGFDWLLFLVLLCDAVVQTILWIAGVKQNIKSDNYNAEIPVNYGINIYTYISFILHLISLIGLNLLFYYYVKAITVVIILLNCLYCIYWAFMIGLTFIYQNYIIKKYDLYYLLKDINAQIQ
jgi:hypothetical protein